MNYQNDPFFQYPSTVAHSSEGDVQLPILYYDTSNFIVMYWVDYASAASILTESGVQLVRYRGNRALVTVAFFEYRNTTVGVYNEVGVALAVMPKGQPQPSFPLLSLYRAPDKRHIGLHIIDLPVTTKAACAAGREIWGYPKFVTEIGFEHAGANFSGSVKDPASQESIMTLSGKPGPGLPAPPMSLVLYSRTDEGQLLRALVNVRGWVTGCLGGSMQLKIGKSEHPMAQNLRALGLEGQKPFLVQYTDAFQSRLNAGAVLQTQAQAKSEDIHSTQKAA